MFYIHTGLCRERKWIKTQMVIHNYGCNRHCRHLLNFLYILQVPSSGNGHFATYEVSLMHHHSSNSNYHLSIFIKISMQSYMDSEIVSIMSQYIPLDNQNIHQDSNQIENSSLL